jgi:hypothetical protein
MTTWVRSQVRSCEICGGQSGSVAGFVRILRFPRQFSVHQLLHIHYSFRYLRFVVSTLTASLNNKLITRYPSVVLLSSVSIEIRASSLRPDLHMGSILGYKAV